MKTIIFTIVGVLFSVYSYAQNDSIAVSQMKELGVYYFDGNNLKQILPIMPEKIRAFANPLFLGEDSENIIENTPVFYVFIPSEYKNRLSAKQFRIVTLASNNGKRKVKSKTDGNYMIMKAEKLNEECYKLLLNEPLKEGHYGIFYNYGNRVPLKLYDFDIVNK